MSDVRRPDDRLRLARLSRGLSQEAAALAAGVTRQAISGIESGRFSPSLEVALALSAVLGTTVEELFGRPPDLPPVKARLAGGGDSRGGTGSVRLLMAEVGGATVGFPLAGNDSLLPGFRPALGEAARGRPGSTTLASRLAPATPTLAVGGCDPALALLEGPLWRHLPPFGLVWLACSNASGLALLAEGSLHAAAVHRTASAAPAHAADTEVIGFASWREGLVVAPEHAGGVAAIEDALRLGLCLANREPGSEARRLLDEALAGCGATPEEVAGYESACTAHLLVASAIASGLADFGVASEPAALAYGLGFVPWQDEICELHVPRGLLGTAPVKALLDVLAGAELPAQLSAIAGYDAAPCGRVLDG